MIDGIKVNVSCANREAIEGSELLQSLDTWKVITNRKGTVIRIVEYLGMIMTIYPTKIILSGSLHKFYNNLSGKGHQNANDFNYNQLSEVIDLLAAIFHLNPLEALIENLEVGLNLLTRIVVKSILEYHLIGFKNAQQPSKNDNHEWKGRYLEFKNTVYSQYLHKFYDKGSQYDLEKFILRWEKKYLRSQGLKRFGVRTLADLKDTTKLRSLLDNLIDEFQNLMIVDTINPIVNADDLETFKDFMNIARWKERTSKCTSTRKRDVDAYNKFVENHELDTLKNTLINDLQLKAIQLLECDELHGVHNDLNVTNCTLVKGADCNTSNNNSPKERASDPEVYQLHREDVPSKKMRFKRGNSLNNVSRSIEKVLTGPLLIETSEVNTKTPIWAEVIDHWTDTLYDFVRRFGLKV